ncbi:MAG: hypothetical protein V1701_04935 [Planctomycetota bacterium]
MKYLKWVIIIWVIAFFSGCACLNRDNRILLNELDKVANPQTTAGKAALLPVAIPVATGAFAVDAVVIHPARQIPKASKDTYDTLWKPRDIPAYRKAIIFVPVLIATPPFFIGDWLFRSIFDYWN